MALKLVLPFVPRELKNQTDLRRPTEIKKRFHGRRTKLLHICSQIEFGLLKESSLPFSNPT